MDGQVFYRYEDSSGRIVIVDALSKVPSAARANVERLQLGGASAGSDAQLEGSLNVVDAPRARPSEAAESASPLVWPPKSFDSASFGAGVGVGLVVALLAAFFFGRSAGGGLRRTVFGGAVVVGLAALAGGAYFGWLRRTTGLDDATFAAPGAVVEDARKAVQDMQKHRAEQERMLEEIDQLAK